MKTYLLLVLLFITFINCQLSLEECQKIEENCRDAMNKCRNIQFGKFERPTKYERPRFKRPEFRKNEFERPKDIQRQK